MLKPKRSALVPILAAMIALFGSVLNAQTFHDDFSSGKVDTTKWVIQERTEHVPGTKQSVNIGVYSADALNFSHGMLRIKVSQTLGPDGAVSSTGGEIKSTNVFGYGTYEFVMRVASTAPKPDDEGHAVSGSDSGGFIYVNNSETEIDFEFLGNKPEVISLNNWINPTNHKNPKLHHTERVPAAHLAEEFHTYVFVWEPGLIKWYLDGENIATHTDKVPSTPAHIVLNHWGTNKVSFGGLATIGIDRYLFVKKVAFTPLQRGRV